MRLTKTFLTCCLLAIFNFSFSQFDLNSDPGPNAVGYIDICICDEVNFSISGNSEDISNTEWTINSELIQGDTIIENLSYEFCESGSYLLSTAITDINDSIHLHSAIVRVSIMPDFSEMLSNNFNICDGDSLEILGGFVDSLQYDGFFIPSNTIPPVFLSDTDPDANLYVVSGGNATESTIEVSGGSSGQTISSSEDISSFLVNIEHSYLGDLEIGVICPNGTTITLVDAYNGAGVLAGTGFGGGNTFLGDANDTGTTPGTGYNYLFSEMAEWGNMGDEQDAGNTSAVSQGTAMSEGTYQPQSSFDDLIGCPISGPWTLIVADNIGGDDGFVFNWGINFDANDGPVEFTNYPIDGSWDDSPWITSSTDFTINVLPEVDSSNYNFSYVDDFNCEYNQSLTVNLVPAIEETIIEEVSISCLQDQFVTDLQDQMNCSSASGIYEFCYENDADIEFTYCPDDIGSGTMMSVLFLGGQTVNPDVLYIYDGADSNADLLDEIINPNLNGLSYTASNPDGCITIRLVSDDFWSCSENFSNPIRYQVGCNMNENLVYQWDPANQVLFDNSSVLQLTSIPEEDLDLTLSIYNQLNPSCVGTYDVSLLVGDLLSTGDVGSTVVCEGEEITLFDLLEGDPSAGGIWLNEEGIEIMDPYTFDDVVSTSFSYEFQDCQLATEVFVTVTEVPDPVIEVNGDVLSIDPYEVIQWYLNGAPIDGANSPTLEITESGNYSVLASTESGCQATSDEVAVVGVNEIEGIQFSLFPNPAQDKTTLNFTDKNKQYSFEIFDIAGKLVMSRDVVQGTYELDLSSLSPGNYQIGITDSSLQSKTFQQIVIVK